MLLREEYIAALDITVDKHFWTVATGVRIAGKLRLARTIPALDELLALDADEMSEWVADAPVEMNSLETLETRGTLHPGLEGHERQYLRGTCARISEPAVPHIAPPKPNRNDPWPCGSGKKYKKCRQS